MPDSTKIVSPSRTYVAMCNKMNFDGYYFKKFTLPKADIPRQKIYANDAATAAWYFLNQLNGVACIQCCIPFEDYSNIYEEVVK